MAAQQGEIRVAANGYGVIGKRVADAIASPEDIELVGIADDLRPFLPPPRGRVLG